MNPRVSRGREIDNKVPDRGKLNQKGVGLSAQDSTIVVLTQFLSNSMQASPILERPCIQRIYDSFPLAANDSC